MWNIYKKELKDSFRDRRTLLLTVFLPLILMSGLILFYEKLMSTGEEETYTIAVNENATEQVKAIYGDLDNFTFKEVANVQEYVSEGNADAGLSFETDFMDKLAQMNPTTVQIFADQFSQQSSLAATFLEKGLIAFNQQNLSTVLVDHNIDPTILNTIAIETVQIVEAENGLFLIAYLIPLMLSIAVGIGASPAAADLFAGEKERKTMEALLMTPVKRSPLIFAKWLTISTLATVTGVITIIVVGLEIFFLTENLRNSFTFDVSTFIIILGWTLLITISYSLLTASLLLLTSLFAKTVKEAQSYSTPVLMISIVPALYTSNLGINEFTNIHFAVPILNLFTIFKELFLGVISYEHLLLTLGSNLLFAIVIVLIGRIVFLKDKFVLN